MGCRDEVIHAINLEREGALGYRQKFHGTFGVALRLKFFAGEQRPFPKLQHVRPRATHQERCKPTLWPAPQVVDLIRLDNLYSARRLFIPPQ